LAAGDLDRDGRPDLAVSTFDTNSVSILRNHGGELSGQKTFAVGQLPFAIAAGSLDGNASLDLVVADSGAGKVSVLLGAGGGSFAAETTYAVGTFPYSVAAADLD